MTDKNNNNDDGEFLVDSPIVIDNSGKQKIYDITDEQKDLAPLIQQIGHEELQYVMDHLEEFEGLTEKAIHSRVIQRVRERCVEELDMELGY